MAIASFLSKPISDTDANFRAWGSGLSNAIQAVGLVKTNDTGQINWTTVNKPATGNTYVGFEIFKFNDTLQSTTPVFLKIEYGSNAYGGQFISLKTTVGKGTDGSGNLTNVLHAQTTTSMVNVTNTNDFYSYVSSGDGSMLTFTLWPASNVSNHGFRFALERSRDANGNPSSAGTFCYRVDGNSSNTVKTAASNYTLMTINTINRGPFYIPYELSASISLNNGIDTPVFKAEVINLSRVKFTPLSLIAYAQADAGGSQIISVDGKDYITLGNTAGQYADCALQPYACLAIAYY